MPASSPLREQRQTPMLLADADREPAAGRVLVVDDDPRNLYAMERILGERGHYVCTARSDA